MCVWGGGGRGRYAPGQGWAGSGLCVRLLRVGGGQLSFPPLFPEQGGRRGEVGRVAQLTA